jgi:hypothetical protein
MDGPLHCVCFQECCEISGRSLPACGVVVLYAKEQRRVFSCCFTGSLEIVRFGFSGRGYPSYVVDISNSRNINVSPVLVRMYRHLVDVAVFLACWVMA